MSDRPAQPPLMIIRLHRDHHSRPEMTDQLIAELARHPGCCDEVWMDTGPGFLSLDEDRRLAEMMAVAAGKFRAAGIVASLQIGVTLGHADMAIHPADGITWQRIVGPDGSACTQCGCPRDPALHDYYRGQIGAYAAWGPAWIWLDDDMRMHHHYPVTWGCFCDRCVVAFAAFNGRDRDRPALVRAINAPDDGSVRLAWTHFNGQALADIAATIAAAAHAVAPDCRLGLQQCSHDRNLYDGPDYRPVFEAMARATGHGVGARLGCGCYDDHAPREMIRKAYAIAQQTARLPASVEAVCPEVENFTHIAMGKSAHGTAVETTLELAMGCNCLSFAVICCAHESLEWYGRVMLNRLAAWRPFWQRYVELHEGTNPGGLEIILGPDQAGRRMQPGEPPFAWATVNLEQVYQLATVGLPLCFHASAASGRLLHASVVGGLSDAELREVLSGGVLMDGAAALAVQRRGLGGLLGVQVEPFWPLDSWERLTTDPTNGADAGYEWHIYFARADSPIHRLRPAAETRVLGEFINRHGQVTGAATVLAENDAGGRVAILGMDGWRNLLSSAKRRQLLAAADWISRDRLPALIETTAQVVAVPRVAPGGRLRSVLLLNASIDVSEPPCVRLRGASAGNAVRWIAPQAGDRPLTPTRNGDELIVEVPPIGPWQTGCILLGDG
ncbi:MAG: hypothetical protein BIFFINMI_01509 [Phycisphaerae bacterium]|nr:hypothetical protein [Phycisphaerae bacterium]